MICDIREKHIEKLINLTESGLNIIYLVSDSVSTSKIKPFLSRFPERVVNTGIAEQDLIGIAAGLANTGFIPFTGNAAPFLINRSAEQLKVDVSYSRSNVKIGGMHAGFSYGLDGITHHEVNDISVMRGFPSIEIFAPCDGKECEKITEYAAFSKAPVYFSFNSGNFPVITEDKSFTPGIPLQFAEGCDITVIALGSAIHDALQAETILKNRCKMEIFALTSIRPLNTQPLIQSIQKTGKVLTVEQHSTHGGAGSITAALMAEHGTGGTLRRLGIPEGCFTLNASAQDNKRHFGLDAAGIVRAVTELLNLAV